MGHILDAVISSIGCYYYLLEFYLKTVPIDLLEQKMGGVINLDLVINLDTIK